MRYCSSCGSLNDTDAKFCQNCGKHFDYDGGTPIIEVVNPAPRTSEVPEPELIVEPAPEPIPDPMPEPEPATESVQDIPVEPVSEAEPVYAAPVPNPEPHRTKGRVLGIIGFILGLEALLCSWLPFFNWIPLIIAIVALILCSKSLKYTTFRLARAGKVISIIAIILAAIFTAFTIFMLIYFRDDLGYIFRNLPEYLDNLEIQIDFY